MRKKEGTEESPSSQHFHWSRIDLQAYRLSWDTHNLTELNANQIALNVVSADLSGNQIHETGEFEEGAITLGKLHPHKLYTVNLEALKGKVRLWSYVGMIETLPTEVKMTKANETEEILQSHHFNWSRVGPQAYHLSWDVEGLASLHADRIRLFVLPVDPLTSPISNFGDFSSGAITLEVPGPDNSYIAIFEAFDHNIRVLYYIETINSPPTVEEEDGVEDRGSTEREEGSEVVKSREEEESGGGEEGATTTSGSGIPFVHVAVMLV
ncbi:Oncosphere antigen B [Taenia solium]|eukprot:TsM_001192600 transcript=TsM_001192600 gene=TsM_001192600